MGAYVSQCGGADRKGRSFSALGRSRYLAPATAHGILPDSQAKPKYRTGGNRFPKRLLAEQSDRDTGHNLHLVLELRDRFFNNRRKRLVAAINLRRHSTAGIYFTSASGWPNYNFGQTRRYGVVDIAFH